MFNKSVPFPDTCRKMTDWRLFNQTVNSSEKTKESNIPNNRLSFRRRKNGFKSNLRKNLKSDINLMKNKLSKCRGNK